MMTVNELIAELQAQASAGHGGLPVVDDHDNLIVGVEFNTDMYPAIVLVGD